LAAVDLDRSRASALVREQRGKAALLSICLLLPMLLGAGASKPKTLDALIATCPTKAEVAQFNRDLRLSFENDPSEGQRCGMTLLRERAYQAFRAMRDVRFTRRLPWTQRTLYGWFTNAVRGVRFRGDTDTSFCCDPARTINIEAPYMDALADPSHGWLTSDDDESLSSLVVELVHEARHAEGKQHTCRALDDTSLAESGAWTVEIMLELWLGLYSTGFYDAPGWRDRYRSAALRDAQADMERICSLPIANVSVRRDGRFAVVRNDGGVALEHVWLATDAGPPHDLRGVAARSVRRVRLPRRATWLRIVGTAADPHPGDNVVLAR
jgi:hypothetical protein